MSLIPTTSNIGRSEAGYNTNAPFLFGCSRKIGQIEIPEGAIQCLRVECTEGMTPPLRISSASVVPDRMDMVVVEISDAGDRTAGLWRAWFGGGSGRCSDFITRPSGALAGHIVYDPDLPGMLLAAARVSGGVIKAESNALVLMPQCLYPGMTGHVKTVALGDQLYHGDVVLHVYDDSASGQHAVTGGYDSAAAATTLNLNQEAAASGVEYGITKLSLRHDGTTEEIELDYSTSDCLPIRHVMLQHTLTSNLRVVSSGNVITFTGVKDG